MFNSKVLLLFFVLFPIIPYPIVSNYVTIEGHVAVCDINETNHLYLSLIQPDTSATICLKIYEQDLLFYQSELTAASFPCLIELPIIEFEDEVKEIYLSAHYLKTPELATTVRFRLSAASHDKGIIQDLQNGSYVSSHPVFLSFSGVGEQLTVQYEYEKIFSKGKNDYHLQYSRYIDFTMFEILIDSPFEVHIDTCEVRFYLLLKETDLSSEAHYTSIEVSLDRVKKNHYRLKNDFRYHIDKRNGNIFEQFSDCCDEEFLPFFFPLSAGFDKTVPFEIIFTDIGRNKETLILQNKLELGSDWKTNFAYVEKNQIFENIEYEYA